MQISKSMAPLLHCCHGSICGNGLIDNIDTDDDSGASCTNYDNGIVVNGTNSLTIWAGSVFYSMYLFNLDLKKSLDLKKNKKKQQDT